MSKKILALVLALVLVCSLVPAVSAAEASATIDFTTTAQRLSQNDNAQVWQNNGLTMTNEKHESTQPIKDYSNPVRLYAKTNLLVEYAGMTKLVAVCKTTGYADALVNSIGTQEGVTVVKEASVDSLWPVTITFAAPVDSWKIDAFVAQTRFVTLTAYAGEAGTTEPEVTEPEATEPEATEPEATEPATSAPVVGTAYKFGMIQENVSKTDVYYLKGGMDGYYMATSKNVADAIDVYLEETEGGYYLYTMSGDSKLYINMVISGTHVNGAYEATASTVYTYDEEAATVTAIVNDAPYWFGTRNDKTYTTVGPCATSYNGFYCKFYAAEGGEVTPTEPEATEPVVTEPTTPALPDGTELSIVDAVAKGLAQPDNVYTTEKYKVTGVIKDVYNTTYGNMHIVDENGNSLTIYGSYSADGSTRYDALEVKPVAGDTVTIYGALGNYKGDPQIKNGWIVNHIPGESQPTEPTEPEPTTPAEPINGTFVQITTAEQLVSGKYVLVAGNGYAPKALDGTWLSSGTPAVNGGAISAADAAGFIWDITVDGTSVKLTDANGVTVAPKGGNNNGIISSDYSWDVLFADGTFQFAGIDADTVKLACNAGAQGGNKFRGYKNTTLTGTYADEYFSYFTLYKLEETGSEPEQVKGDLTGDGVVTNDDVIVLLWHSMFPEENPIEINVDFNGDDVVTNDDVIVLLWHSMFPEENPL